MRLFERTFELTAGTRILDVGGTPAVWDSLSARPQITFLNVPQAAADLKADWVAGDGCALPFRDRAFDIVFSNSVIEHVGGPPSQAAFAAEVRRVGKAYWIQTPNRWFPLEPHLWTPFIHWLPPAWQRRLLPWTLWNVLTRPSEDRQRFYFHHFLDDIRLLTPSDVRLYFPGATLIRERVLGLTKSLTAVQVCDNESPQPLMDQAILKKMREDWDARARENARYYVATGKTDWTDQDFFLSGERTLAEEVQTDMTNVCQGMDPKSMRVLEIGCGAGRVTRALAGLFGEVHGVDVSGEMVARAAEALKDRPNAKVYQNNGTDLSVIPDDKPFDFAFSTIVFQHIPSREVIENYVREVHRLLRPGALFKFQVQGDATVASKPDDTWLGVPFSEQDATEMAHRCGFEPRYRHGAGGQYFWLWYFRT